jgi:hypothetical protein
MSRIKTSREKLSGDTYQMTTLDLDPIDDDPLDRFINRSDSDKKPRNMSQNSIRCGSTGCACDSIYLGGLKLSLFVDSCQTQVISTDDHVALMNLSFSLK